MIFGCLMSFKIWISLATLSTSATSEILSFSKILTATYSWLWLGGHTFSPVMVWLPNFTLPKVPSPIVLPEWIILFPTYDIIANAFPLHLSLTGDFIISLLNGLRFIKFVLRCVKRDNSILVYGARIKIRLHLILFLCIISTVI